MPVKSNAVCASVTPTTLVISIFMRPHLSYLCFIRLDSLTRSAHAGALQRMLSECIKGTQPPPQ